MQTRDSNRRRFQRVPIDARVGVILLGSFSFSEAVSLSEGGLSIRTSLNLNPGDKIQVQMLLWSEVASADGEVVYVLPSDTDPRKKDVGIRFIEVPNRDLNLIQSYVTSNMEP